MPNEESFKGVSLHHIIFLSDEAIQTHSMLTFSPIFVLYPPPLAHHNMLTNSRFKGGGGENRIKSLVTDIIHLQNDKLL